MASFDTTASRFLRPSDVARLRRNQRRIQAQRLLLFARNACVAAGIVAAAVWAWRHTQSNARFAVQTVAVEGAVHTPRTALDLVTSRYVGLNLFKLDIERVRSDLAAIGWVRQVDIEKALPDTLRIKITERAPVALVRVGDRLLYVDDAGSGFAELSPAVGNDELPIITDAHGTELTRTLALLRELHTNDRELYSRISEVWPIPPAGFAIYDRAFGAVVYANAKDISPKYRRLYAVLAAEKKPKIEYADLRFADRIVVKPLEKTDVKN